MMRKNLDRRNSDIDRRCRLLYKGKKGAGPVVYWMSRDQRVQDNWALLWAQQEAIIHGRPLLVVFCLVDDYQGATQRHYSFMRSGFPFLKKRLADHNITFQLLSQSPERVLPGYLAKLDAHALVCDFDPLRIKRRWKEQVAAQVTLPVYEVDTHNIIPVWLTSDKKEYAAYTIRPKIKRLLDDFLTDIPRLKNHPITSQNWEIRSTKGQGPGSARLLSEDQLYGLKSGEDTALLAAENVLQKILPGYFERRNDPCSQGQSGLSPYLHFGQLSPQRLAYMVLHAELNPESKEAFLEELVVRRELADNFCFYEPSYDSIDGFPRWGQKTLEEHKKDRRDYLYTLEEFEQAVTHEPLWNGCQQDLVINGRLHGYLRMYWAKKILEWSPDPESALAVAITLNDRYSLDGRDPNGYTGIAWSLGGVHDRAWRERPVFGKIRYMNEAGCRRKFNVDGYISSVHNNRRNTNYESWKKYLLQ